METIVGFVAGYLAGAREGRDGLDRLRTSWRAIRTSPEVRRLAGQAVGLAESAVKRASGAGLSGAVNSVTELLSHSSAAAARRGSRAA